MAENVVRQRLAAILAADVAGYSRLMGDDERATIDAINRCRAVFREHIEANGGRVVDMAGDSVLAIFDTAIGAFTTAMAAQERLADLNTEFTEDRRMLWRIGVNLGDIHEQDDGTAYGDGINVAARLEALAEPGGICLSDKVHTEVRGKIERAFADLGEHEVKNIAEPVRAYRVLAEGEAAPAKPIRMRVVALAGAAVVAVVVMAVALWPSPEPAPAPEVATAEPDDALPPLPSGPSIAVLPFDNLGGDPEQEYFADGLTEDILTRLAAFSDLKVIARNSSFQYKGEAVDVREVGRNLGAAFVLEGSVRRDATSIRISAQLLDSEDGAHVWQETYDRELSAGSIFAIQDDIAKQVAAAIGGPTGAITASRLQQLQGGGTNDLESYECVLLAQHYSEVGTAEAHLAARTCLAGAVERDPNYVEGLAWLGLMYQEEYWSGFNPRETGPTALEASFEVLNHALQLDPGHQIARKALAVAYYYSGDAEQFREEARKAVALNPNDATTLGEMAMWVGYSGDWVESKVWAERLRSLVAEVPAWHNWTEFNFHYRDKDFVAAAASARATLDMGHWASPWYLALAYAGLGEDEKALEALAKARALEPNLTTELVRGMMDALFLDLDHIALLMDGHAQLLALEDSLATQRPVIAVLPFDNLSGDPEEGYFADGITEDIITRLSKFSDLKVIARNSTFQYKDQAVDVRTVAEALGASHIVEGSVRRAAGRIRVSAQLLDAKDGAHLWAESFDRDYDVTGIFDIQDEITDRISATIGDVHGIIARTGSQAIRAARPESLETFECIVVARRYFAALSAENAAKARACLERVVLTDPDYAEAWAWLASIYYTYEIFWAPGEPGLLEKATAAVQEALDIDPNNQHAHMEASRLHFMRKDCASFSEESDLAISINPNETGTLMIIAWYTLGCGDWAKAVGQMQRALELNPKPLPYVYGLLSYDCYNSGDYECAVQHARKGLTPGFFWGYVQLAAAYGQLGREEDAAAAAAKLLALYPEFSAQAWSEFDHWFFSVRDFQLHLAEGLRKAGLDIPEPPTPIE